MMNQLTIFDYKPDDNQAFELKLQPHSPISTLKRVIKARKFEPEAVERRLMEKIGTLLLHKLNRLKDIDDPKKYYDYLLKKIYNEFFKEHIDGMTTSNSAERFKLMTEVLSDDTTSVKFELAEKSYSSMTQGVSFYIYVEDSTRKLTYITGSEEKSKAKHRKRYWYPHKGRESFRMKTAINRILSEVLLEKEMRHYYRASERKHEYCKLIDELMIKGGKLFYDFRIRREHPTLMDTIEADAKARNLELTVLNNDDTYMYHANHYHYKNEQICTLNVLHNRPISEDLNGASESYLRRLLINYYIGCIVPKIREVKYHVNSLKKSSDDYASTYQLKKNIPEKTLDKMKSSKLLKYFSDVEYDELVDLSTVTQFEEEIISYIEKFGLEIPSCASFKVRRLGKIKAAGVFHPGYCTLVVDIQHPEAFIHEFWHMIDYYMLDNADEFTGWRLSSRSDFADIINKYREVVNNEIEEYPEDSLIRKRHFGSSKYNKDYFFENTEIFARSAEMYFSEKLGKTSSLVGDNYNVYYPMDEDLRKLIDTYFMKLLKGVDHEKIEAA